MATFDIVIKYGMIIDGTRVPRYRGDIGISNGIISAVGKVDPSLADRVIDTERLIGAPGLIDLHVRHNEYLLGSVTPVRHRTH